MSIRADLVVRILPRVVSAVGVSLRPNGLLVTQSNLFPALSVTQWTNADDVRAAYGETSPEYTAARIYFKGYTNSNTKPRVFYIASAALAESLPWVNGSSLSSTLTQLKAVTDGSFEMTLGSTNAQLTGLDFSGATSFSAVGEILQTALQAAGGAFANAEVSFNGLTKTYRLTAGQVSDDLLAFPAGTAAQAMSMTSGMISKGSPAKTFAENMTEFLQSTRNFVSFTTAWEADIAGKLEIAEWVNATSDGLRFVYFGWDTDINALNPMDDSNFGAQLQEAGTMGTAPVYNTLDVAAFAMGIAATLDPSVAGGRATFMGRHLAGLATTVSKDTDAVALAGDGDNSGNGYNFYGDYATANENFLWFSRGTVSGQYKWLDTHICAILIKNDLQYTYMRMIQDIPSVPYNQEGYAIMRNYVNTVSERYLAFGAIQPGVPLSEDQKTQVINDTGMDFTEALRRDGWYLYLPAASAEERQARTYRNGKFYYMDGGSVQQIDMTSTTIL